MLITQANLEKHLQIDVTTEPDPVVTEYIAQAQAACEAWCGQKLEYSAGLVWTGEASQDYVHTIVLPRFPITTTPTVVENDAALVDLTDFRWFDDGRLQRLSGTDKGSWTTRLNKIVVTYDAGYGTGAPAPYDTPPADLALAITVYAAALWRHGASYAAQGAVPIKSITLAGSDSISYAISEQPGEPPLLGNRSKQLLAPYVRWAM